MGKRQPVDLKTLGGRVKYIRLSMAPAFGKSVGLVAFAELVAKREGAKKAPHGSTVKGWEEGAEPTLATIKAIAAVARDYGLVWVTDSWIAFGGQVTSTGSGQGQEPPGEPPGGARQAGGGRGR